MAIICKKYKLLYILIGSTGCTSISKVLTSKLEGEWLPEKPIPPQKKGGASLEQKHNTLKQLFDFGVITKQESKQYLKFANVRNPFDVYATSYARYYGPDIEDGLKDKNSWVYRDESGDFRDAQEVSRTVSHLENMIAIARQQGFDAWLDKNIGLRSQLRSWVKWNCLGDENADLKRSYNILRDLDDFIRFENLEEDFNRILKKAGVKEYTPLPNVNPTTGKKSYKEYYSPKSRALIETVFRYELEKFGYSY